MTSSSANGFSIDIYGAGVTGGNDGAVLREQ